MRNTAQAALESLDAMLEDPERIDELMPELQTDVAYLTRNVAPSTFRWHVEIEIDASTDMVADGFDPGVFIANERHIDHESGEAGGMDAIRRMANVLAHWPETGHWSARVRVLDAPRTVDVRTVQGYGPDEIAKNAGDDAARAAKASAPFVRPAR